MKSLKFTILFIVSSFTIQAQILFSETFSTSLGQCSSTNSVSGAWIFANTCSFSSSLGHSASGHAVFSGSGCQFGNSTNAVSGNLNTPTIAIGPSGAVLTFNYRLVNECGSGGSTCFYDDLRLQISNNGGTSFTDIMSSSGTPAGLTNNNAWTPVSYTLNAYSSQTIIIRFNFNSVDGVGNAYDGVYIDDIIITGNCSINLTSSPLNSTVSPVICSGNSITLTTNAVSNYSWSNGATTPSIVVSPTNATMYSVIATSSANCTTSASLTVQVNNAIPSLSLANSASVTSGSCPNATVVLTASGANSYAWSGGSTSIANGLPFVPSSAATYTVIGTNACGTSSVSTSLSIHPVPTATAVASTSSLCSGSSLTLTGLGTAATYTWFGGSVSITNGVGFTPPLTATYTLVGTSALGCTVSATIPVTVQPTPINPPTANPALLCIGGSSTLSATGASNYTWTSATQTVNTANFIVTPNLGVTTYTITKANSNCVNTQIVTVVTNSLPTIFAIVTPTVVCALTPATLAVGGGQSYTWTAPGPPSYTFTGASPVISPVAPSIYSVAASDGTCINTTTVYLNANPNPTILVTTSTPTSCAGTPITLTANGGLNYTWTASNGYTTNGQTATNSPTIPTSYMVAGENNFGCTSSASQVILVYAAPNLTVTTNKIMVCNGAPAILTASGANTYSWDANANSVLTNTALVNPTALISSAIVYTVEGTNSTTLCKNTKTVVVNVFIPTLTVSGNTNTCQGGSVNLGASGGVNGSYSWNTGSSNPIPTQNISTTLTAASVFTVTANSSTNAPIALTCPASQTVGLGIYFNPTITAVAQKTTICTKESVNLTANGGVTYNWNNNMTGSVITVAPSGGIAANFTVTGTDANGCTSTGTVQVRISGCTGINELNNSNNSITIYPNPNDGRFTIQTSTDLKLSLVNELGQLIRVIELSAANNRAVDISDLAKGIYFVTGQKDNLQVYQKIVVTK